MTTHTTTSCSVCGKPFEAHASCFTCGRALYQPEDPGRYKHYCSGRCRQKAYRLRHPERSHSGTRSESARARAQREWEEAWAREEARKEQDRQRKRRARGHTYQEPEGMPSWCRAKAGDDENKRRQRERARALFERGLHRSTNEHERDTCLRMAEKIRVKHGL